MRIRAGLSRPNTDAGRPLPNAPVTPVDPAVEGRITQNSEELVRAAQAGDRGALDDLLGAHLPLLYNVIGRALNGHADVDDLVQDTMVRVVRGLPALRDPARF